MIKCSKCKPWFHVGMHINVDSCALTKWTYPSCHV